MEIVLSGFAAAFEAHGSGRLEEAEQGYRSVLAVEPRHADAWHLLGVIAQQRGQSAVAVEHIRRALDICGPQGQYLANLGVALTALGRSAEAVAALEQAVKLEPGSFTALFALGNGLRGLGRLEEAVTHYRRSLVLEPANASAQNNLGNALQELGRHGEAEACYRRTITLQPGHARAHYNLGIILKDAGRLEDAADSFRRALTIVPDLAEAHVNLGVVLHDQGHLEDAVRHTRKAIALNPKDAAVRNGHVTALVELGLLHKRQRRFAQAIDAFLAAAEHRPDDPIILNNLGNILTEAERAAEAEVHLRRAVALAPDMAELHYNLGNALNAQGKDEEAVAAYVTAIALRSSFLKPRINLGVILQKLGKFDDALRAYEGAVAADPSSAEAVSGTGVVLQALGRDDEALQCFQNALKLKPDLAEAHRNAALALLMAGDFAAGWEAYEWRWRCDGTAGGWRDFPYPQWQGESGEGTGKAAVLVWGEQGVGDKVLYAGMIPDLIASGHGVVMETDARLVTLFERSFPGVKAVVKRNPADAATSRTDIGWHSPLASLGRWLRPDAASFPKRESYLIADKARAAGYRALLSERGKPGPIVGISWVSRSPKIGRHKTLDLDQWAPILRLPGVQFVDLQYGDTAAERAAVEADLGVAITHIPDLDLREDIDGVAALAAACDLVISVSNSTVHLAASLGRPTWVLVPASAGNLWYWMRGCDRSPWYPSATIFRQAELGNWRDVLADIESRLKAFSARSLA